MCKKIIISAIALILITGCSDENKSETPGLPPFTMPDNPCFHTAILEDIDGDGVDDIVAAVEWITLIDMDTILQGDYLIWFKGDPESSTRFESDYNKIGYHMSGDIEMYDIDNDGDKDIIGASYYTKPAKTFGWYERAGTDTEPVWIYHNISSSLGAGFQLDLVEGLYSGTTGLYAVGTNHTNTLKNPSDHESAVFIFQVPDNPKSSWGTPRTISSGISAVSASNAGNLAPGAFTHGDLDSDGDIDLVVSGDGDPRIFVYEQAQAGVFTQHVLEDDQPQTGLMKIYDLNNDGYKEIIMPCYENSKLFLYKGAGSSSGASNIGSYYYNRITLNDATTDGPAFISIADMNDDGSPDIIVSLYGPGLYSGLPNAEKYNSGVTIYLQGADLDSWTEVVVQPQNNEITFATKTDIGDIDGDDDLDILLPTGFFACQFISKDPCGGIVWYENPGNSPLGENWVKHVVWEKEEEEGEN